MGKADGSAQSGRIVIRIAKEGDLPDVARIYNDAILNTTATFDTVPKTVDEWREIFAFHNELFPLVVAEVDSKIVGWGALRSFIKRPAARHTVEDAVYVDPAYRGKGIGSVILRYLLNCAKSSGHHAVVALVVAGNAASERLHEKMGFERIGVLREVGNKFNKWLDLIIYEKIL